ncbi:MAG: T9SS C-terminal target domain-containing protein [Chitinophagaceae bacterium]|nr:MAG: T9SS C-terminal target domain-containing protein [Chitinophagaceae bacterium]
MRKFKIFTQYTFSLLCIVLCSNITKAASSLEVFLEWGESNTELSVNGIVHKEVPYFKDAFFDEKYNYLPAYRIVEPINTNGQIYAEIRNEVYQTISLADHETEGILSGEFKIEAFNGSARGVRHAIFEIFPFRRNSNTGQIEKLISFDVDFQVDNSFRMSSSGANTYPQSSVLSSGDWYKIAVEKSAIHKINRNLITELGLNPDNIDPSNVRVFGIEGGMLPEYNGIERTTDLRELAVEVSGAGSGSFSNNDYVLFYGSSPHAVFYNEETERFDHQKNLYTDKTFYFINISSTNSQQVTTASSVPNPNNISTHFSEYKYVEDELVNLIKSGRQWYGDNFGFAVSSRNYTFESSGIQSSSPVYVESAFVARSLSSASTFNLRLNGQQFTSHNIASVSSGYTSEYARRTTRADTLSNITGNNLNFTVDFVNSASSSEGWIDYLKVNFRRSLRYNGEQFIFTDLNNIDKGVITEFRIANFNSGLKVWDITDPIVPVNMSGNLSGSEYRFSTFTEKLKRFIVFNPQGNLPVPEFIEVVENQNLHAIQQADMIIVYHPDIKGPVETLASHHRNTKNLNVITVNVKQIYNEFSAGSPDISAIRDFTKMLYDRNAANANQQPKYLLLFGNGSYDNRSRVQNNINLIPTYQSHNSLGPVSTFVTDDFFAFLDDNEGDDVLSSSHLLDVAVGRLPARTLQHAQDMVDKIIHYESTATFGNWRNDLVFLADDGDSNLHLNQTERLVSFVDTTYPLYNINKIYFDAYPRQSTPGGARFPDAQQALNNQMFKGSLIVNYLGHGGVNGWAHERVLTISDILSWTNYDKMPLFVTATCEFSRFDDPTNISAGEHVLLNSAGGGIGLVTTVRLVFASANEDLNRAFLKRIFEPINGEMPSVGEALLLSKNLGNAAIGNTRKFVLLGDPAMRLAYPEYDVVTTSITEDLVEKQTDTLSALGQYTITGEVRNENGTLLENFNGFVYPLVFDKVSVVETLGQSGGSFKKQFELLKNTIYRGKATVKDGKFSFTFIVPKDIMFKYGQGKISYYANTDWVDAAGFDTSIIVGGTAEVFVEDNTGPEVEVFMNDETFVFGGITDPNPLLYVKLRDESGINTVGSGIGHDLTAVLNDDTRNVLVLNDFYEADLDNFRRGTINYPLSKLPEGRHSVRVKAWDVHNNSGEGYTEFVVSSSAEMALNHVYNYPNPFTTSTNFMFEHNQPGQILDVQVQIFTVTGKLIKSIHQEVVSEGYRVDNIHWDGLDDFGDKIGRGVYVYKVNVRSSSGLNAHKFEKLVILR